MAAFIFCFFVILCVGTLLAQANWGGAYHSQFDSRQRYQQGLELLYGLEGIGLNLKEAVKWFSFCQMTRLIELLQTGLNKQEETCCH